MGTAVLFPQDCLPISRSRHRRSHLFDACTGSPLGSRNAQLYESPFLYSSQARHRFTPYHGHGGGQLYLDQARYSFSHYSPNHPQNDLEQWKPKFNRQAESTAVSHITVPSPNITGLPSSQSPMKKERARELFVELRTDPNRCLERFSEARLGSRLRSAQPHIMNQKKSGANGKNGSTDVEMARGKFQPCKLGQSKFEDPNLRVLTDFAVVENVKGNRCRRRNSKVSVVKGRRSFDDRFTLKPDKGRNQFLVSDVYQNHGVVNGWEYFSSVVMDGKERQSESAGRVGVSRLRRALTDSQIVEQLGHYRSQALEIPSSDGKTGNGLTRSTSMSLPERWAGPAYFSSPAPSSLPLPKFSLLGPKTPPHNLSPLSGEQQMSHLTKPLRSGSTTGALRSVHAEGESDVVFATKSLRRMLKLDPA